jgi:BolA family transcriptional regulator, general stress-responsive regulator
MSVATKIESKVNQALAPEVLEVTNESNRHSVAPGSETHFKLVIVSTQFTNQNRVQRHRKVNELLAEELQHGVHALSLKLYTPGEWDERRGKVAKSPPCMGGSKHG